MTPLLICFSLVLFSLQAQAQGTNEVDSLPIITRHPQGDVLPRAAVVTLQCEAERDNLPILFTHNGMLINENNPTYSIATGSLTINGIDESTVGEYVCLARNQVGNRTFTVASSPALIQLRVFEVSLLSDSRSSPHNITTTVGNPVVINCTRSYNTLPAPTFGWRIETPIQRSIAASDNAIVGINGSLYLQEPTLQQNGVIFSCSVRSGTSIKTGYIRLIVEGSSSPAPAPVILSRPMDVVVSVGTQQANFECITGGSPVLPVTWTASSPGPSVLQLERGYRVAAFQQGGLGLQPESRGQITCSVQSLGSFTASLDFIEPPAIRSTLPGTTQVITYGDPLSLRCDSDSRAISWYWFHNGLRLAQFTGPELRIASLAESNTGSYQCYVVNDAGISHGSTYVQVQTNPAEIQQDLPVHTIVYRDEPASLHCMATGAPPPSYQWLKDNIPLSEPFQINPTNGTLRINTAMDVHSGRYTCRATNRIGSRVVGMDETSTTLTVITPTRFTQPPVPEPTLDIQLDTSDTLFCEVSSDSGSTLQFSWTKDDQPLVLDGTRVSYVDPSLTRNGSIRIARVTTDDAGLYVCTVSTMFNGIPAPTIKTTPTQVMVTVSPASPTITNLSSPSPTSVEVTWIITSNLNRIRIFSIEIRQVSMATDSWRVIQRNANAASLVVIDNLTAFTRYVVRVNASYVNGEETSSELREVVTMETLPGDSPKAVMIIAVPSSDTSLEVKWQPPSQPNGVIVNYIILYRLDSDASSNQTATVGSNTTTFTLKNLEKDMIYVVRIAAVNSVGQGPFSEGSKALTGSGALMEPDGPVYQRVWFIALMVGVVVVVIIVLVLFVLIVRYKRSHRRSTGKYHVRPQSGYFGGGGPGVGDMTDDAASDYLKRSAELNAFGSPTNSEALDAMLERETIATTLTDHSSIPYPSLRGTPQLPNGTRYMGIGAPGYINPPSFEEAISRSRKGSRSSRPQSGASNTEKSPSEWSASHNSRSAFVTSYEDPFEKRKHFGGEGPGQDSSFSVHTYSDGDSEMTDATEYSHLAGAGQFPRNYHHLQVQTPQNATLV